VARPGGYRDKGENPTDLLSKKSGESVSSRYGMPANPSMSEAIEGKTYKSQLDYCAGRSSLLGGSPDKVKSISACPGGGKISDQFHTARNRGILRDRGAF